MIWVRYAAALIAAYLLGSIPMGYITIKLFKKIDIRRIGSGHTGGSNVLRAAGLLPAGLTVLGDFFKGYGAVALAKTLVPDVPAVAALAALSAVVGHDCSILLGFKGGVGTVTTVGSGVALMPIGVGASALVGGLVVLVWKYTSLGSLTMAAVLPLACLIGALVGAWPPSYLIFALGTSALSIWALRANIGRLRKGTERKLGQTIPPGESDVSPEEP